MSTQKWIDRYVLVVNAAEAVQQVYRLLRSRARAGATSSLMVR